MGGGLALHWGRGGGRVVGGVGVRAAALAPPFDRSDGAAVCWWWWSVWDGGWEAPRVAVRGGGGEVSGDEVQNKRTN